MIRFGSGIRISDSAVEILSDEDQTFSFPPYSPAPVTRTVSPCFHELFDLGKVLRNVSRNIAAVE